MASQAYVRVGDEIGYRIRGVRKYDPVNTDLIFATAGETSSMPSLSIVRLSLTVDA